MNRKLLLVTTILAISILAQAYTVSPVCPDFADINADYVVATTGNTSDPFIKQGVVNGRHTLITAQGTDSNTGGLLSLLPAGESRVIRLGNEYVGAEAEALTYHFIVDKNNPLLLLKFAVVLEDPKHLHIAQPRFVVRITDKDDNLIEDCAEYDVSAREDIPGFQTHNKGWDSSIRWRDWTNVGLDMSSFIGKEVQVQFITYDCYYGAHFGYAYFSASCVPNNLQLEVCTGTDFTVEAPDNFESYLWDNGETTRTSTRTAAQNNSSLSCLVTSATGCQFTLNAYVSSTPVAQSTFIQDTICEGDIYAKNYFQLPEQYEIGTNTYYNAILNTGVCNTTQITELELTVLPRYTRIKAAICGGNDYIENGFNIIQPATGVRRDTLFLQSKSNKCDSIVCLELTVSPSLTMPNMIDGDGSPCTDILATYSFAGAELLTNFSWQIPANARVVGKSNQPQITLYFTDNTPAVLSLSGENGCGSGSSAPLNIHPRQTYAVFFTDTICSGTDYDKHGFRLGVQNEIGYFVHSHEFKSVLGCDSLVALALTVFPAPAVPRIVGDTVSCNPGNEIKLLAMDSVMAYTFNPEMLKDSTFTYAYDCDINYLWSTGSTKHFITEKPNSTTTYNVTLFNSMGCSATAYQRVLVRNNAPQTIYDSICAGETYTNYGLNKKVSGIYPTSITDGECTIPVTVNLTVLPVYNETVNNTVCYGTPYTEHGLNITPYEEGLISQTFRYQTARGCDSLVTVKLLVLPEKTTTIRDTICQNDVYVKNGFMLPAQIFSGLQTHTKNFTSAQKCDSIVTLKLFVKPVYNNIISDEANFNEGYNKYNFCFPKVTQNVTATKNLKSVEGCDSTVILNLKVDIPKTKAVNDTVSFTPCQNSVTVNVLANDSYPCSNPVISILDNPFPYTSVTRSGNQLRYYPNFDVYNDYFGKTDSVRYSITCGTDVDTAWVFFQYPPSLSPWIEVESRLNKTCFALGDTITEEITLRYNCTVNQDLRVGFNLDSPFADFEEISSSIVTLDNTYGHQVFLLTVSHKVINLKKPVDEEALTTTSAVYIYNSSLRLYIQLNDNKTICPELDISVASCSYTWLDLEFDGAVSYQITQQPQFPDATASIVDGDFFYFPPEVSEIKTDTVKYEIGFQDGTKRRGSIILKILPCINSVTVETTLNDQCNLDSCNYDGPSILINEAMITPLKYNGAIYGYQCNIPEEGVIGGGEWIELYNPNTCEPVDISGYFMGNSTIDYPSCNTLIPVRNIGAAFILPEGTVIPPMGFCVLRGEHAIKVDPARLVENGGNTVVINVMNYFDRFCLDNTGNRFWLPDRGGWFGFYDRDGVPQDAIYWGQPSTDICADCTPCNPHIPGTYTGALVSLNDFPDDRKTCVATDVGEYPEETPKRQPDGGNWIFNDFTPPTIGYCNGICNTRADSTCTGMLVDLKVYGGIGPFTYQWDDPWQQTTGTATMLCEGTYYCTITDHGTGLTRLINAVIVNNPESCPEVEAVNDTVSIYSCRETLRIPLLKNDFYTCAEPEVSLLSNPALPGSTVQLINDTLVYRFQNVSGRDSLQYKIVCDGFKPAIDSAWVFIEIKNDTPRTDFTETLCHGDSILFGSIYCSAPRVYRDTLTSVVTGCDSIVTLTLYVIDLETYSYDYTICKDQSYDFNGKMLSKAGVYVDTVPSITTGCDSIITLTLSVIDPVTYSYDHSICKDQSYDFNGKMLNKTGVYVDTILSITTGCDSIITLTLSVIDPVTYSYDHSICKDQSYDFNGKMLSKAGVYVDTVPSIATSCDSIVTLTLDVIDPVLFSYNKQICTGNSYLFGNQTLTTSGIYTDTVSSIATGCDSIVTLNLSVQPYLTGSYSHHICQGDGYWFGGKYLTQTDIYHDTLHTLVVGCDSIATLYLTVDTLIRQSVDRQICAGEEYLFGDQMLTAQGTYRDTLKSVAGCDSIIATLRLTVAYPSDVVYLNETISKGENYILNGHVYNQSGIYVDTLTNYAGCDSVIVLYLEVFECPEIEIPIFFTPNSDNYNDKWEIRNIDCYEHVVEIYDRFGKLLRRWENNFTGWDGTYLGNRMPSTDYWYMVTLGKGEPRMGHFTLIR